jgi:hypothetical protein
VHFDVLHKLLALVREVADARFKPPELERVRLKMFADLADF